MSGRGCGYDGGHAGRRPVEPGERGGDPGAVRMRRHAACGRHALHVLETTLAHSSAAPDRTVPVPEDDAVYRSGSPGWSPVCGRRLVGASR